MAYTVLTTHRFDKSVELMKKRGLPVEMLREVISLLVQTGTLPQHYRPHKLKGFRGNNTWECHIQPDWLLIWEQDDNIFRLLMVDTGTHSDLFGKKRN